MNIAGDFKHAFRLIARRPGYFLAAILILSLGTGVTGVVFNLINATLLRPLGGGDPGSLVRLYSKSANETQSRFSYPDYLFYREQHVLDDLAATNLAGVVFRNDGASLAEVVSTNYFSVLRVAPQLGRAFAPDEDRVRGTRNAVISDRLWERLFSRDPGVLGRELWINNEAFVVVGVAPRKFNGTFAGASIDAWVAAGQVTWMGAHALVDRDLASVHLLGRLPHGVKSESVAAALTAASSRLERTYPRKSPRTGVAVEPAALLHGPLRKGVSVFLSAMLVIAALVLLTACANLANVALMHAVGRRRELAVRAALGAGTGAMLRQFAAEGIVTALAGGALGLLVAQWAAGALLRLNPIPSVPLLFDFSLDWRVVSFQLGISLLTGVALGFVPALHFLRSDFLPALKEESGKATSAPGRSRLRNALVISQVAVSLVLLTCAGLFLRSLQNARTLDLGFDPHHALAVDIDLGSQSLLPEEGAAFFRTLVQDVSRLPGVESATLANLAPLDIATPRLSVRSPASSGQELRVSRNTVDAVYFRTLRIPLLQGREFSGEDTAMGRRVVIVNETLARRFWPGHDPIGMEILTAEGAALAVVGVARDVKYRTLGEDPEPHLYLPFAQNSALSMTLLVRTSMDPGSLLTSVQQVIPRVHPSAQGFFARTLDQHTGFAMLPAKLAAVISMVLGVLSLILAAIGIYGSVGYSVSIRTREIGIRMALGATPGTVLLKELRHGMILTGAGIAAGMAAALLLARAASRLLYGITAGDPLTFLTVPVFLALISFLSIYVPAHRIVRVSPATALRNE